MPLTYKLPLYAALYGSSSEAKMSMLWEASSGLKVQHPQKGASILLAFFKVPNMLL